MYTEHIAYHARREPKAIAVATPSGRLTYGEFDLNINRVAHRLGPHLPARARIAVSIADPYAHWLVILALGRLGHVSVSASRESRIETLSADVVLIDHAVKGKERQNFIELSASWFGETLQEKNCAPIERRSGPRDAARIVTSSGTTGTPKKMLFSHEMVVRRFRNAPFAHSLQCDRRNLCAIGLGTSTGFTLPLRIWWFGGTMFLFPLSPEVLLAQPITSLTLSVGQLSYFIKNLPDDFPPVPELTVNVAGSALPLQLAAETRRRLTPQLIEGYGSNEAGTVAWCPAALKDRYPGLTGLIIPGVTVEIVDDKGQTLPLRETGEVRVRSDEMVHAYVEDDEANARAFRDGWFHPGDLGYLSGTGALHIIGRADEVMNLGGWKMSPEVLEQALASYDRIEDVGAFSMADEMGSELPWLAIVAREGFDQNAAVQALRKATPTKCRIVFVPAIPRNELGKIERNQLKDNVKQILRRMKPAADKPTKTR